MLIVFEGGDGSGKSTQVAALTEELRRYGVAVTATREPGGSPELGPMIRKILLHTDIDLGARAEALLFAADRAEHVRTVIAPALARGEVVVCDRFVDSTLAYQGSGRLLPDEDLLQLCAFATDGLEPDLVVVCDIDPDVAAARQRSRGDADRMELADLGRHVRDVLLRRAGECPGRYVVVDADGTVEQVTGRVLDAVLPRVLPVSLPRFVSGVTPQAGPANVATTASR